MLLNDFITWSHSQRFFQVIDCKLPENNNQQNKQLMKNGCDTTAMKNCLSQTNLPDGDKLLHADTVLWHYEEKIPELSKQFEWRLHTVAVSDAQQLGSNEK